MTAKKFTGPSPYGEHVVVQRIVRRPTPESFFIEIIQETVPLRPTPSGGLTFVEPPHLLPACLVELAPHEYREIVSELGILGTTAEEEPRGSIYWVIWELARRVERRKWQKDSQTERQRAHKILTAARRLKSSLVTRGPDLDLYLTDIDSGQRVDLDKLDLELEQIEKSVEVFLEGYEVRRGRPRGDQLEEAVIDLCALYEHFTGKNAARASRSQDRIGTETTPEPDGPFFRFCRSVIRTIDTEVTDDSLDHVIRAYLKERRQMRRSYGTLR